MGLYFRNILFYSLKWGQNRYRKQHKLNICIVFFECLRSMVVLFVHSVNIWDKLRHMHEDMNKGTKMD